MRAHELSVNINGNKMKAASGSPGHRPSPERGTTAPPLTANNVWPTSEQAQLIDPGREG